MAHYSKEAELLEKILKAIGRTNELLSSVAKDEEEDEGDDE